METIINNIGQVLGITLIHSLWQGLLIYLAWRILLLCLHSLSSENKYRFSLFALFGIAAAFIYTFYSEAQAYNWQSDLSAGYVPITTPVNTADGIWVGYEKSTILKLPVAAASLDSTLKVYLPYIAVLYIIGLTINLSLIGLAWNKILVIKKSLMDARYLQAKVDVFSAQFNITNKVRVSFSRMVDVPCVIGYLKPILLLPITLTTLLSAEEVEAILLHELSHIKNNDYVLNLVQQVISVLLFFNPFAQLISRAISRERENRCDDWVINVTRTPLTYASALVKLEETRYREVKLALATTGKKYHLRARIERMLKPGRPTGHIRHLLFVVLLVSGSLLFFLSFKTSPQTAFNFSGKLFGGADIVSLKYTNEKGNVVTENCVLENGTFNFKGHISGSRLVFLTVRKENNQPASTSFFLEPGTITAAGSYADLEHLTINGSNTQHEYQGYQSQLAGLNQDAKKLNDQFRQLTSKKALALQHHKSEKELDQIDLQLADLNDQLSPYRSKREEIDRIYIATHPDSYVSALQLIVYAKVWQIGTVKKLFNGFSPEVKNSSYGDSLRQIILEMEGDEPGTKAKNFITKDVNGRPISLNDFKGKFVLLNFWTRLRPDYDNAPHLINIFNKYHNKGLEIIGVADDDSYPDEWKKSIQKHGTGLWHHVLRGLKYNKGQFDVTASIADKFDVSVLPTRILIDRNGTIIGRYVGTEGEVELDKKLAVLFDKRL